MSATYSANPSFMKLTRGSIKHPYLSAVFEWISRGFTIYSYLQHAARRYEVFGN